MIYEYIAVPSVNISVDLSSYDVTEELEEKGLLGVVSEDSEAPEVSDSFQAAEDTLPQASSADIAKQRAERFLEWTKNIDSLHESGIQSAEKVKAQFQSSFSENDIYGKSRQFDYANRYIVMRPQYEVYSWHSFEDRYNHDDFYYVRIRGGYSPSESEKKRTVPLVKLGYSSWYDLDTWFDTLTNSNVMLYQYDPENDNREYSYTNSRGINIGGNVGFTSNSQGDSTTIGGSAGINFSKSTTYKGYDYDIEDHSYSNGVNNARWIFRFKHPEYAWQNPSVVSRGTLRPKVEAVWRVKPDYYKNHGKSYILNFRHQGALGSTSLGVFLRHMDYGKSTYRDYMFVDAPPRIMAESTSIELPATFGNSYINITADEQCTATVFDSNWRMGTNWVAIMNSSRFSGNHQLMLYRFRNTSSSSRTAYIVLVGRETGAQVTIKVTQKGR
ncbi:MAG: leukocidin family pore-forming toxin [Synergistaceae bacterium]|nr:leukocidin family pore-forming toxin [Synergistaceae bacterium]